jgi:hypothetical protein
LLGETVQLTKGIGTHQHCSHLSLQSVAMERV